MERFSRQTILPEIGKQGQAKLANASVLIIGAGGLGCPVFQTLGSAGVGTLGIVDADIVSESNLARQTLYNQSQIGRRKVDVLQEYAKRFFPEARVNVYPEMLDTSNALNILKNYDVVVDGADNFYAQYLINDACVIENKPWVFASILKYEMQVSTFNYQGSPSYRCLFPEPPSGEAVPNCAEAGVISSLPPLAGNMQANEVLKIMVRIGQTLGGVLWQINALNLNSVQLKFQKIKKNFAITDFSRLDKLNINCKTQTKMKEIAWAEAKERLDDFHILDVRNPDEFAHYNVGGDNVPVTTIAADPVYKPKAEKPILVICQGGVRSVRAIEILEERDSNLDLYNLTGGVNAMF